MGEALRTKTLSWLAALTILALLATPWILRFRQERFEKRTLASSHPFPARLVDLTRLRERLPGNLYWRMGAPTEDPNLLRWREEEEQHWNRLNGKVLSNTATEEEIHAYYAHRRRVSEDFMAFALLVLQEYGDRLSEPERGLYEQSIRMHRARLEELPQQLEEALTRKRFQDPRRTAWNRPPPR
ncbi:hypothetical protein [Melittangium boletus]|uniref:Uncharacterized protein n=1 Tax=Melittangium boletus DSM 14713 TaxID=1294270 RepID=A0A250I775_9BACT|nr:hypothetical protein [Melittangium boletus]ATB27050.1 hypothetical protein MEBOL_000485 [Melittangium boletus DSM 14713]